MIHKRLFGYHPCGKEIYLYELSNNVVSVELLEYGATIHALHVFDSVGKSYDVVGGFDTIEDYIQSTEYQGSTVGRVCNRLKNAEFTLDGITYRTYRNEAPNSCHSGKFGFDKKLWDAEYSCDDSCEITFNYISHDGEEGFPGNLTVSVKYRLDGNRLVLEYIATTDKRTVVNLTNHSYFNMNGYESGSVEGHLIRVAASHINETDSALIPTGNIIDITGTPFDMNSECRLGSVINGSCDKLRELGGLDCNYIFDKVSADASGCVAELTGDISEITMRVYTDSSGMQIYTANSIGENEPRMKNGVEQVPHFGICLECASMPDSPNNENFDDITLNVGDVYRHTTVLEFIS